LPLGPAAGTFDTIVVKPGDALRAIAKHLYGHADRADEIFAMNRDKLDDPDHIYAGMSLRVPVKS
jgi:nucleoid-associated protein YgaU